MTGKTFRGPTMNWNAVFAGSRCSIAASVAARTGTAFCYATDAVSLMRLGGSKMRLIDSNWSSVLPGSTVLTGIRFDGRPPLRRVNNSNAFASAINVSSTSPPLKLAGLSLLQRNFCPHSFFPAFPGHKRSPCRFCVPAVRSRCDTRCAYVGSYSLPHATLLESFRRRSGGDPSCGGPPAAASATRSPSDPFHDLALVVLRPALVSAAGSYTSAFGRGRLQSPRLQARAD